MHWNTNPQTLERALALGQHALALNSSLPAAHSLVSNIYALQQHYDQAIAEGEQAIALEPNHADSYASQASVLCLAGRYEEALQAMKQAMRLNPRYPSGYLLVLGVAYRMTGQYAEAITRLKECLSRSPNLLLAYMHLASSYLMQWGSQQSPATKTLEPAVAAIQRALALNASFHENYIILGYIYLNQQHYEQALVEIERGITLAPSEAGNYAALAMVLSCMGRTQDALDAVTQALCLQSELKDGHLAEVGITYMLAGRYQEAIASLTHFLARSPNSLVAHLTLAAVYSELGRDAEAQTEAAEVLRLNPNFSLAVHKQRTPIKDPVVLESLIAALRKAGLK